MNITVTKLCIIIIINTIELYNSFISIIVMELFARLIILIMYFMTNR